MEKQAMTLRLCCAASLALGMTLGLAGCFTFGDPNHWEWECWTEKGRDCQAGSVCIKHVCYLSCTGSNSECPGEQVCAADKTCRTAEPSACDSATPCPEAFYCNPDTWLCQKTFPERACENTLKDGAESDIDCGGTICPGCADGKPCLYPTDCASGVCAGNVCQVPTCYDGVQNGDETAVDSCGPHTVGGTVAGLNGSGLALQNNGADDLLITDDGPFAFAAALFTDDGYSVTVLTQPSSRDQICTVTNGTGVVDAANVTSVQVSCVNTYTVGGTVSGLSGDGLILQNNGGDNLPITADGVFTFANRIPDASSYQVSIKAQPSGQSCSILDSAGTVGGADITNVSVACFPPLRFDAVAGPTSPNTVTLSWDHVGATSYNVYYASRSGFDPDSYASYPDGTRLTKVTSPLEVKSLVNGRPYYFVLEAAYPSGHAQRSAEAGAMPNVLSPNGFVAALATDASGNVYLGGSFTAVGVTTGGAVPIRTDTGRPWPVFPIFAGTVHAVATDGAGGWYVGGSFTSVGGEPRQGLAHIIADGTLDDAWGPAVAGSVSALAVAGSTVYVGGTFTKIGTLNRNNLAAIGADGGLLEWDPNVNGSVNAIAVSGTSVYIGGSFWRVGADVRSGLAAFSTSGGLRAWAPSAGGGSVQTLAVSGGTVYVGGDFTQISSKTRNRIAAIDASGNVLDWDPNADNVVYALAVSGNTIYAGGEFREIGGDWREGLAAIAANGNLLAWNPEAGDIHSLVVSGNTIYVGGQFPFVGGTVRNCLAAIDANGNLLDWNPRAGGAVLALAVSDDTVYAGGAFATVGGVTRNRLAALDTNGALLDWNPNSDNYVSTLATSGDTVYVGGWFASIAGVTRNHLAAIDTSGSLLA